MQQKKVPMTSSDIKKSYDRIMRLSPASSPVKTDEGDQLFSKRFAQTEMVTTVSTGV